MVAELELLRLIDLIYQGALDAGCWANAIAEVGRAFGAEATSLYLHERPSCASRYQLDTRFDETFRQSYAELSSAPDMAPAWRMTEAGLPAPGAHSGDRAARQLGRGHPVLRRVAATAALRAHADGALGTLGRSHRRPVPRPDDALESLYRRRARGVAQPAPASRSRRAGAAAAGSGVQRQAAGARSAGRSGAGGILGRCQRGGAACQSCRRGAVALRRTEDRRGCARLRPPGRNARVAAARRQGIHRPGPCRRRHARSASALRAAPAVGARGTPTGRCIRSRSSRWPPPSCWSRTRSRPDRQRTAIFGRSMASPGPRRASPRRFWMRTGWRTSRKISASRCRPCARICSARSRRPTRAASRSWSVSCSRIGCRPTRPISGPSMALSRQRERGLSLSEPPEPDRSPRRLHPPITTAAWPRACADSAWRNRRRSPRRS